MNPPHPQQAPDQASAPSLDPSRWVERYGEALYRYALVRVRLPEVAEDLVQEALLAGLRGKHDFQGTSAEQTWLTGILRHKIMDHFRSRTGEVQQAVEDEDVDWLDSFFDEKGQWLRPPDPDAVQPQALLERKEFWDVLDACLDDLPPRAREVFARRVMENEETAVIRKAVGVSSTNLGVILFRARAQMRRCLMLRWFEGAAAGPDGAAASRSSSSPEAPR